MLILEKKRDDERFSASSPLWLSIAVNMLMAFDHDDFEKMSRLEGSGGEQIESYLSAMAGGFDPLPGPLFLSLINKEGTAFGRNFTEAVFNYIACSPSGLREKDLEKILREENITWDPLRFASLRRWFRTHLILQGEEMQWNLAHSILKKALMQKMSETYKEKVHKQIAAYLISLPDTDKLKIPDTMYHLVHVNDLNEVIAYYTSEPDGEVLQNSTHFITEMIVQDESMLAKVASFPQLVSKNIDLFAVMMKRFIYSLNDNLTENGNLNQRLLLLSSLWKQLKENESLFFENADIARDAVMLNMNLGKIHLALGHLTEAQCYYLAAVTQYYAQTHVQSIHKNVKFALTFVNNLSEFGDAMLEKGFTDTALLTYRTWILIYAMIPFPKGMSLHAIQYREALTFLNSGDIAYAENILPEALKSYTDCNTLMKKFYRYNPVDSSNMGGLANSYAKLGAIHLLMDHKKEALDYFMQSYSLNKELYQLNPNNEVYKKTLAISNEKLGDICLDMVKVTEAQKYFDEESRLFKELHESNPLNESYKSGLARSEDKKFSCLIAIKRFWGGSLVDPFLFRNKKD